MNLSAEDIAKVALLARLRIDPGELASYTEQINKIIHYVEQLQQVDTSGVEPLAHGVELRNVFREDRRTDSLPREEALENAPRRNHEAFLVPAVLQ
jgi:aspartyl-tRNA(Asn)/glutamyl-tRNA(Gln) amidotransferase subunit C